PQRIFNLRAVRINDGVSRIFPSLVLHPLCGARFIFVESALVPAILVGPGQRLKCRLNEWANSLLIASPMPDFTCNNRIEKRGIRGSEIQRSRIEVKDSQRIGMGFVRNSARLCVPPIVGFMRL